MDELCIKYPALSILWTYVYIMSEFKKHPKIKIEMDKEVFYRDFKANISCIGLEPSEYETVIKWFCDTMEY